MPDHRRLSKFLSLVLRHQPQVLGIELDAHGWTDADELLRRLQGRGMDVDWDQLVEVVETNDKQRFALDRETRRIRANQGHSVTVDLGLSPQTPPARLYHGTSDRHLEAIRREGLNRRSRQHVHLYAEEAKARGRYIRQGRLAVVVVQATRMAEAGFSFYRSENNVWLTEHVPPEYLDF